MKNLKYNNDKVIDSCSLFGMMNLKGKCFNGKDIIKAITNMHVRGNGLGAGFAVYGLFPEYKEYYCLQILFQKDKAKQECDSFLKENFVIVKDEEVPHRNTKEIVNPPIVWRYFVNLTSHISDDDYVLRKVMSINTQIEDTFVFSSGKDMAVFKGVGFPEDIADYFELEHYTGYIWTAHGRFPTNTPGWWGGAHPFCILDWTVVHNGEISSYGINRRFLEMYGYYCTMHTDTEVMAYAVDLLIRQHNLPIEVVAKILAAPLWSEIDRMPEENKKFYSTLRQVYGSLLMNGPFVVIIAHQGEMIGLGDRIRLRPLTAGITDEMLYLSSEESGIRLICPDVKHTWIPKGGEPIIGRLKDGKVIYYENILAA